MTTMRGLTIDAILILNSEGKGRGIFEQNNETLKSCHGVF